MTDRKCGTKHTTEIGGEEHEIECLAPIDHTGVHRWMSHGGALLTWPNEAMCGETIQAADGSVKVCRLIKPHGSPHMDESSTYLWLTGQTTVLTEREKGRDFERPTWREMFREEITKRAAAETERPAEVRDQPTVARTYAERKKKGRR